ncbi:unnamed protein product, partial [Timema podura]|nr:unnamed protein product [Timema podura]
MIILDFVFVVICSDSESVLLSSITLSGRIVESKNTEYKVGKYIVGSFGWRTKTIVNPSAADNIFNSKIYILPDLGGLSESLGVGVLGMP